VSLAGTTSRTAAETRPRSIFVRQPDE